MAVLDILVDDDPVLRRKANKIKQFDASLKKLAADMFETMRAANGIGLAGNQVGVLLRIIVVELTPDPEEDEPGSKAIRMAICNPEIVDSSGTQVGPEGCLSLPGWVGDVPRFARVTVRGQSLDGKPLKIKADGLFARALQHEVDHLEGILFTDRVEDISTLRKLSPREAADAGEVVAADEHSSAEGRLEVVAE